MIFTLCFLHPPNKTAYGVWNSKTKMIQLIHSDFDKLFLSDGRFQACHAAATSQWKRTFINNLKIGSLIDCKDLYYHIPTYYSARVQNIVDANDVDDWNNNNNENIIEVRKRARNKMGNSVTETPNSYKKYAYIHYRGWRHGYDEWIGLCETRLCDCQDECNNKTHEYAKPFTQCMFERLDKAAPMIYSKKHSKLMIIGKSHGVICSKYISTGWISQYCHNKQSQSTSIRMRDKDNENIGIWVFDRR